MSFTSVLSEQMQPTYLQDSFGTLYTRVVKTGQRSKDVILISTKDLNINGKPTN